MKQTGKTIVTVLCALLLGAFASVGFLAATIPGAATQIAAIGANVPRASSSPLVMSDEELVDAVKPAVVRVTQHIQGDIQLPHFDVDIKNMTIRVLPGPKRLRQSFNEYLIGSGFAVNPDGDILTNSHVVSTKAVEYGFFSLALFEDASVSAVRHRVSNADVQKFLDESNSEARVQFGEKIRALMMQATDYRVSSSVVTVFRPVSAKQDLQALEKDGFPATVQSVNDAFIADEKDVALVHINEKNVPSLRLGTSEGLAIGTKISVFGFPAVTDVSSKSLLESTFTQGVITAKKDSQAPDKKKFFYLQIDAKISEGSSGGPLLNAQGDVVGIVTAQTQGGLSSGGSNGDNFAFAIPVELVADTLRSARSANTTSGYFASFEKGLGLLHDRHCEAANESFASAKQANANFIDARRVDAYINQCAALIASGRSIDSAWDEWRDAARRVDMSVWLLVAGLAAVVAAGGLTLMVVMRKMRRDEKEIHTLEDVVSSSGDSHAASGRTTGEIATQTNEGEELIPADPELVTYVRSARESGMSDDRIRDALKQVGWLEYDVEKALRA